MFILLCFEIIFISTLASIVPISQRKRKLGFNIPEFYTLPPPKKKKNYEQNMQKRTEKI